MSKDKKIYKPKPGTLKPLNDSGEVIVSAPIKEAAAEDIVKRTPAKVFSVEKTEETASGALKPRKAPDYSSLKSTVSEENWNDFEKIELGPPPVNTVIPEEKEEKQEEFKPEDIPDKTPAKDKKQSDMAVLNAAMSANAQKLNAEMESAVDPEVLRKAILAAAARRDALSGELETLTKDLSRVKADMEQAQKEYGNARTSGAKQGQSKEKLAKDIMRKKEDVQAHQGKLFEVEQSGNEAKISKAKEELAKAKELLKQAEEDYGNFDENAAAPANDGGKYLTLQQEFKTLESSVNDKRKEFDNLKDSIVIQEKRLKTIENS
ncbi:MAG: hypothetical protein LBK53_03155 [Heliobacteriaceae bacterium]|jgi:hypothetical protein|nr:hypothetical protein [Heliobacteriaceae bacterium]